MFTSISLNEFHSFTGFVTTRRVVNIAQNAVSDTSLYSMFLYPMKTFSAKVLREANPLFLKRILSIPLRVGV